MAKTQRVSETRSPLKEPALRNPGESIQEEVERIVDRMMSPTLYAAFAVGVAAYEWWRWLTSQPPRPVLMTVLAGLFCAYALRKVVPLRKQLKSLRLGIEGEKAVSQYLNRHGDPGWFLIDDIPAGGFNVDHVLVTRHGVFALETKTYSKPTKGEAKITYDGVGVRVNGFTPDRNPVTQAAAVRDWVCGLLEEMTGKSFPVRGVVVVPGWWVDSPNGGSRPDVWVLNQKALPKWIRHEPIALSPEDVALAESRLRIHASR